MNLIKTQIKKALIGAPNDEINDIDSIKNLALQKHKSNIS